MRILSIGVMSTASAIAGAQSVPRQLALVPDLRIEAKQVSNPRDAILAIGPKGQIVATMRYSGFGIVGYDSTGKPLGWTVPTGRGENIEIGAPASLGWVGATDTMWVADYSFGQLALVDGAGKVVKSIELPSWIHPSWSERRKYPVFARMEPLALLSDQTMLIIPSRPRSLLDTPEYDRASRRILRTTWDGAIRATVARLPDDNRSLRVRAKGCDHTINVPFAGMSWWSLSPDGTRLTIVSPGVSAADSGAVRVTTLNERGDTVYSRSYPQPAARNSQTAIDTFLGAIRSCGPFTAEQLRDSALKRVAPFKSFVTGVLTGRDHSTWIITRFLSDSIRERGATILDPRGDVVGQVTLPFNDVPLAVDRDYYWSIEPGKDRGPATLVRKKVQPTGVLPARSAPASVSSKPTRPPI